LQNVIKSEDLPVIIGVVMVKETPAYDLEMLKKLGYVSTPFFMNLVPYAVHREASAYSAKKEIELNGIRESIETDSATCLSKLEGMGLPESLDVCDASSVPEAVLRKSEEVKAKGGPDSVTSAFEELQALSLKCRRAVHEAMEKLEEEEAGDERIRLQYKESWERKSSKELNEGFQKQLETFSAKMLDAEKSDGVLENMLVADLSAIITLCQEKVLFRLINWDLGEIEQVYPEIQDFICERRHRQRLAPKTRRCEYLDAKKERNSQGCDKG
jgi:programmed cell death 6-interacting protein